MQNYQQEMNSFLATYTRFSVDLYGGVCVYVSK